MKVTVCFGSVRVLVPCGAGDLLVRDLVREATLRYKKATGQGPETWVGVRALRASSGGILDPDDRVCDVADDRETLTAECASQAPQPRAAQADGASGSSAGTASPDMFRGGGGVGGSMRVPNTDSCVEVGAADLEDGANGLQVRRGSEPTLHQDTLPPQRQVTDQTKRWSAAVVCRDDATLGPHVPHTPHTPHVPHVPHAPHTPHTPHLNVPDKNSHFQRQSNRLSMQFSGPGSGVWMEAAERAQMYGSKSLPRDARREPLGQDTSDQHRVEDMLRWVSGVNNVTDVHPVQERPLDLMNEVGSERAVSGPGAGAGAAAGASAGAALSVRVALVKGEKGLGFTITTRDNPTGGHCPIYIKNILPKGAAVMDGRLRAGDKLVSVNGVSVSGLTQQQVVTLLRNTPTDSTVEILVERNMPNRTQRVEPQQSPTKYIEKAIGAPKPMESERAIENGRVSSIVNAINAHNNNSVRGRVTKSSSKDDLIKDQSLDTSLQDALNSSTGSVSGLRNRLILRLEVPVHESEKAGLGISVKGKVTAGPNPHDLGIFIKSVLHGGAASRDGRLHTNDQLLSVNGVSLVGLGNARAMDALRRALLLARPDARGSIALTVARRTDSMDNLARWKDDTPPNGNDTTNSNETSQNYNTVIYNNNNNNNDNNNDKENKPVDAQNNNYEQQKDKKHASVITINNNSSWISNQSDDSKGYLERDKDTIPHDSKRDSFEWSRLDGWNPVIDRLTGLRNESYYMATQIEPQTNGHLRHNMGHVHMSRSPPAHHNVIIEEDYGTRNSNGESGSESGAGGAGGAFSRDAVGRRSMSEKRHAALDAKATGTYKKIREIKAAAVPVGPALGMRKSSSLESLQTAIQETQRNPRNEPIYARAHPPLKHWLTDDSAAPEMVRGSPQQSSLSHKKPSLLKSLSTMFRIGKPHKKEEAYARAAPARCSDKAPRDLAREQHREELRSRQNSERSTRSERRNAPALQAMESAWGPTGHYVNYEEIQQNLNLRREKLSEVQIGQMRRLAASARDPRDAREAHDDRSRAGAGAGVTGGAGAGAGAGAQRSWRSARTHSNYYEYDAAPPRRPGKLSHYH